MTTKRWTAKETAQFNKDVEYMGKNNVPFMIGHAPEKPAAAAVGRAKGGVARAKKLPPERRSEIARQAALARHSGNPPRKRKPTATSVLGSLTKKIEACKARIAAERDKLRDLLDEANDIADSCEDAVQDLDRAISTLSQYL